MGWSNLFRVVIFCEKESIPPGKFKKKYIFLWTGNSIFFYRYHWKILFLLTFFLRRPWKKYDRHPLPPPPPWRHWKNGIAHWIYDSIWLLSKLLSEKNMLKTIYTGFKSFSCLQPVFFFSSYFRSYRKRTDHHSLKDLKGRAFTELKKIPYLLY